MIYSKENPEGIDQKINLLQKAIHNRIDWNNIEVYGRVYRNPSDDGYRPEAYVKDGEYKDVFTNDLKSATIFFIENEVHNFIGGYDFETEVKIVFMLDLKKIFGTNVRNDSEVQNKAILEVRKHKYFTLTKIEKGIDNILKGFNTSNIKINDMQPYHVFAIVGKLKYSINQC